MWLAVAVVALLVVAGAAVHAYFLICGRRHRNAIMPGRIRFLELDIYGEVLSTFPGDPDREAVKAWERRTAELEARRQRSAELEARRQVPVWEPPMWSNGWIGHDSRGNRVIVCAAGHPIPYPHPGGMMLTCGCPVHPSPPQSAPPPLPPRSGPTALTRHA